jgi:hypothetical protein
MKPYTTLCNLLFGETISLKAAKAARKGRWTGCVFCRLLNMIHRNHCEDEYAYYCKDDTDDGDR